MPSGVSSSGLMEMELASVWLQFYAILLLDLCFMDITLFGRSFAYRTLGWFGVFNVVLNCTKLWLSVMSVFFMFSQLFTGGSLYGN